MSDTLLNILPGTMPVDCYPASADAFQTQILTLARAVFPGTTAGVAIGDTAPTDHTMVWAKTDASNNFIRFYTWGGTGEWVSQHPIPPSPDGMRWIWTGIESDLVTRDEGNSDPITPTTGAFWVADHAFDALMPIGVGTLASGTGITVLGTGGEEKHSLIASEMPPHTHTMDFLTKPQSGSSTDCFVDPADAGSNPGNVTLTSSSTGGDGATPPVVVPHNNLPPYIGVFFIKRTARQYYVG